MFLAHFVNEPLSSLFEWTLDEIHYWHIEAVKVHNRLNESVDTAP